MTRTQIGKEDEIRTRKDPAFLLHQQTAACAGSGVGDQACSVVHPKVRLSKRQAFTILRKVFIIDSYAPVGKAAWLFGAALQSPRHGRMTMSQLWK